MARRTRSDSMYLVAVLSSCLMLSASSSAAAAGSQRCTHTDPSCKIDHLYAEGIVQREVPLYTPLPVRYATHAQCAPYREGRTGVGVSRWREGARSLTLMRRLVHARAGSNLLRLERRCTRTHTYVHTRAPFPVRCYIYICIQRVPCRELRVVYPSVYIYI